MKNKLWAGLAALALALAWPAPGQTTNTNATISSTSTSVWTNAPNVVSSEAVTVQANVQEINAKQRMITLRDQSGNVIRLKFTQDLPSLSQVHKGDLVTANYYKSVAVMLAKPGEEPTGREQKEFVIKPESGTGVGGMTVSTIHTTAMIETVDPAKRVVSFKEPDGHKVNVKVDASVQNLDQIKPGDKYMVTYTESVAIVPLKPVH